ncbi:MAG: Fic family protein [Oscillospiraceae bacterium]|nr:Fic family protein [Oscillospiraceae bacterium]
MDATVFAQMLSDKRITDLKRLKHKYQDVDLKEFVDVLKSGIYREVPLPDFSGNPLVYLDSVTQVRMTAAKILLSPQKTAEQYGLKAMEDEIASTFTIENIDFSRDSVRKILRGFAPTDDSENRIYGMKKGLEFISDPTSRITEENIFKLYSIAIRDFLEEEDQLLPNHYYRHDTVYVVGQEVEHTGLPHEKIPEYMAALVAFIQEDSAMNDLVKAAIIHFYLAYLHPYFDGNGRMARLIHLWYLVQQGYTSAMFIPLSEYVEKSRKGYYNAYTLAEQNAKLSGVMDVTPFLVYFIENVYHKLGKMASAEKNMEIFRNALETGAITEKEKDLWLYVLSAYGNSEFSTKQLEKDYGNAAYATIRSFVLKFEKLGLLTGQRYANKVKYRV